MKKNPKVSIIIPVYNGSNYMKDAIDSALAQTYQNLEIIVVNDGSKDDGKTRDIALSYGGKIRYFEKENGGVSTALNLGIEKMTGDYFSWLSHDDMYYPNKVERQVELLKNYDDYTILYSDFSLVDGNKKHITDVHEDHKMLEEKPDYAILRGAIGGITLLIPRTAFKEIGTFPVEYRCVQDYELWFQMTKKYKFVHIPEVLAITRVHPGQDSNTSPLMLSEGNWLWFHMAKDFPLEKKIAYEGSEYLFYREMADYLKQTPYDEAREEISILAQEQLEKNKDKIRNKKVTVVVEGKEEKLQDTIISLKEQTLSNVKILVCDSAQLPKKHEKYQTTTLDREALINKCDSDFIVFIQSGYQMENVWLEEQVLHLILTNKGFSFSDTTLDIMDSVTNNETLLSSIPFYGTVFDSKKIKVEKVKYNKELEFLYNVSKKCGFTYLDHKFFENELEITNPLERDKELLSLLLESEEVDDYTCATLAYKIACSYNETTNGKKVYMNYPCAKYTRLLNSRSFRLYEKLINLKSKIRK